MSGPWFRRYAGFGYRPITRQGSFVVVAMVAVEVPCGAAFLAYADTRPTLAWSAGLVAVLAAVVAHVVVAWKMDWGYGGP
jgi:hypothetical protein